MQAELYRPGKFKKYIYFRSPAGNLFLNQQVTLMLFLLQYLFWYLFCRYPAASINVGAVVFMSVFPEINS